MFCLYIHAISCACDEVPNCNLPDDHRLTARERPLLPSPHLTQFASTFCRQPALSVATVDTSHQLLFPVLYVFFAVALLYSVLDLSRLWRPSGVVVITGLPLWLYPFFIMCPVKISSSPSVILAEVFRDFLVGYSLMPTYLKYSRKAFVLEDVDLILLTIVHLPYLATIHQDWFD